MKEVKGFNGRYVITTCGRIYSLLFGTPKRLKTKIDKNNGYEMINFGYQKKSYSRTVHSIMGESYLGLIRGDYGITVNHIDGIKLNNYLYNLELLSRKENIKKAFKNGLYGTSHKVLFEGIEYHSKTEMRRQLGTGYKKQNKLIQSGEIKLLT